MASFLEADFLTTTDVALISSKPIATGTQTCIQTVVKNVDEIVVVWYPGGEWLFIDCMDININKTCEESIIYLEYSIAGEFWENTTFLPFRNGAPIQRHYNPSRHRNMMNPVTFGTGGNFPPYSQNANLPSGTGRIYASGTSLFGGSIGHWHYDGDHDSTPTVVTFGGFDFGALGQKGYLTYSLQSTNSSTAASQYGCINGTMGINAFSDSDSSINVTNLTDGYERYFSSTVTARELVY
ncbi:MAG TPA: hypothetical protein V6C58_04500 [Allocoleopsis sp.]